jgi:hypothetical protein
MIVAIRKPSRDTNDATLSDERYETVIKQVEEELQKGIKIKISPFKGSKIFINELNVDSVYVNNINWNEIKHLHFDIPYTENIDLTLDNAIDYRSNGINAFEKLDGLLISEDSLIIKRLLMYLTTKQQSIEINKISRDGAGIKHAVSILDCEVYQLLLKISLLFSFALEPTTPGEFIVKNSFLLERIKDYIYNSINKEQKSITYKIEKQIERKHWEHQTISINEMKENHNKKGHFIWIPVGMGKTDIVLSYLLYLNSIKQLPLYVIYTLPQTAMKSIINEMLIFGFDVKIIVPVKKEVKEIKNVEIIRECKFKPNNNKDKYNIYLIEHDYLRRCESELIKISSESIFIIDEVHKALNDTKRTTTALEVSRLSKQFIALTGTPVIDSKIYKLMWWLQEIVPFELNEHNFFVAINNMISQKVNTGIKVERIEVSVIMNKEELIKYQKLVPMTLGGINKNMNHDDLKEATELCYDICTKKMIKLTIDKVKEGKGVFLVAKNSKHQQYLYKEFKKNIKNIFVLEKDDSIFLTSETKSNIKIVITTINKSAGYTLTKFDTMISSIYPSNNATREQLEGRINRIGSKFDTVYYYFVHAGILTYILNNHNSAKSLSVALKAIVNNKN